MTKSQNLLKPLLALWPLVLVHGRRENSPFGKRSLSSNGTTCYDELGCFPTDYPWTSLLRPLPPPMHPADIRPDLFCYTRESPERSFVTLWPQIELGECSFNANRATAFIAHGFIDNGNNPWVTELKDAYLDSKDVNFFIVDWHKGSQVLNYLQAASNARIVGAELARFLHWLINNKAMHPKDVHLVGHSLGSHICAYAAKATPGIGRITGELWFENPHEIKFADIFVYIKTDACSSRTALDPAQPGFEGTDKTVRLDKDDADYVDVLHTNAAPFLPSFGFGLMFPVGDVDVYLNGGLFQPGCRLPKIVPITGLVDLAMFSIEFIAQQVACSHLRAYAYFTSVLRSNCTIWAQKTGITRHLLNKITGGHIDPIFSALSKCDPHSCLPLGLETPEFPARGVFAATTRPGHPYCEADPEKNRRYEYLNAIGANKSSDFASTLGNKRNDFASTMGNERKGILSGVVSKGQGAIQNVGNLFSGLFRL